jgi:hypothetical protein
MCRNSFQLAGNNLFLAGEKHEFKTLMIILFLPCFPMPTIIMSLRPGKRLGSIKKTLVLLRVYGRFPRMYVRDNDLSLVLSLSSLASVLAFLFHSQRYQ